MNFRQFIFEGGQESGKMELLKTDVETAYTYANKLFKGKLDEEIPDFRENYEKARAKASLGKTQRKDMPVIDEKDVKLFQARLENGEIDVNAPYTEELKGNPFPEGLTGKRAKQWLEDGLPIHDKAHRDDDKVKVTNTKIKVGDLKPIQKQIYFDKSIEGTAEFGVEGTKKFLAGDGSTFIVSADNFIIDGHHRMLSGMLIDPNMKVNCLVIDLPIKSLLPMSLAYGDAVGNKRNA